MYRYVLLVLTSHGNTFSINRITVLDALDSLLSSWFALAFGGRWTMDMGMIKGSALFGPLREDQIKGIHWKKQQHQ